MEERDLKLRIVGPILHQHEIRPSDTGGLVDHDVLRRDEKFRTKKIKTGPERSMRWAMVDDDRNC